jgi:sialic acid synthase SpsE
MRSLYQKAQTPLAWFGELSAKCREVGIPWFASVFGKESLMQMEYYSCAAYKIASFERDQTGLREAILKTGKPVIISRPDHPEPGIFSLHCAPGYPQEDPKYIPAFDGFSYHGTSVNPIIDAAFDGAQLVEFHFQLSDEPSELESNVSIDEHQLKLLTAAYSEQLRLPA